MIPKYLFNNLMFSDIKAPELLETDVLLEGI